MISDASPPLEIVDVSKRYGETVALRGVTIAFNARTVHTILGENGSGKSTLVKLLSGIVAPDSGAIRIDGAPFRGRGPADFMRSGFATVFQEVLIAPDRSVVDNVLLGWDGLWQWKVPPRERSGVAAEVLSRITRTRIPLDAAAGTLPLALQQIIVVARALVRRPRILILDEATAALDHADREAVFSEVETLAASGGLVLFISHRMDEVTRLSDRISVLRAGQWVGTFSRDEASVEELLAAMAPLRAGETHRD